MEALKCLMAIFFMCICMAVMAQGDKDQDFTVVFYNAQKFYDILDDTAGYDDDFTPKGDKKWTEKRYTKKKEDIAKVISSIGSDLPDIVGFAEIENKKVLNDLASMAMLMPANYQTVHYDSKDESGTEVALLYKNNKFQLLSSELWAVRFSFDPGQKSRDVLYVKGIAAGVDTLHIIVNHWKSRKGKNDGKMRDKTAKIVENAIDSLMDINKKSKIIVMGDFNDEPTDNSVMDVLKANNKRKNTDKTELFNLFYDLHNLNNEGTFSTKGKWYMFDQIMVSQELLYAKDGLSTEYGTGKVFKPEWLLVRNPKANDMVPDKTYGGDMYLGGVSDHLPVYAVFQIKK